MNELENKQFALFPDSVGETQEEKQKFSFRLGQYILNKKNKFSQRKLNGKIQKIHEFREDYKYVDDLSQFRQVFATRLERGETLEEILPEAYAVVLEAISRTKKGSNGLPIELTDSQIMTSLVLNDGDIAELATGEGKTYALIMAAYLNTLTGEQVHIFTANDYLAQRDSEINFPIFDSLGVKVGCALDDYVVDGMPLSKEETKVLRKEAYQNLDIVYAKSSTIAFDWELDQQVMNVEDKMLKRPFHYAIVDEVDSVLIDEANTPLIISQTLKSYENRINDENQNTIVNGKIFGEENRQTWLLLANTLVSELRKYPKNTFRSSKEFSKSPIYNKLSFHGKHLSGTQASLQDQIQKSGALIFIDERNKTVELTEKGYQRVESIIKNTGFDENEVFHYIQNALYAHCILEKNVDYRIDTDQRTGEKKVILIDSNTGRNLTDNKLSNGLHQALEVKEIVNGMPNMSMADAGMIEAIKQVSKMNISTAKVTQPSFFAKYQKVGGTSGTVSDEITKSEFREQYKKKIIEIPRSKKKIAVENPVEVYATRSEKIDAIVNQILECNERQQPILVGARDIDEANEISEYLEEYKKKPFKQLCCEMFQVSEEEINILHASKLYCLLTNTEFPLHDRKVQYAISKQVQSLILPENEKTPLDYRFERKLQEKLDMTPSISLESKIEIYRFITHQEPQSKKEVEDLYRHLHGISFQTLTAENVEQEVEIISQAGRLGAVTIATAIAGRGTDIALGGDPKELARHEVENTMITKLERENLSDAEKTVRIAQIKRQTEMLSRMEHCDDEEIQQLFDKKYSKWQKTCSEEQQQLQSTVRDQEGNLVHQPGKGLYVLGASLNDSIRVDNQLSGRSGRQGSDGESKFMCSLGDPLIIQKGNQSDLNKIRKLVKENPSNRLAIQYVRAAQRANESIQASIRMDSNRSSKGFDWIADMYYSYRKELLEKPEATVPNIFHATSTLLFDNPDQKNTDDYISYFVPLLFSDNEVNNLSDSELKLLFEERTKEMVKELKGGVSHQFKNDLRKKLLTVGDLKFTMFADENEIEKQLSLEQMTPNQSSSVEDLLDRIVFKQYHDFKNDVILETSITAMYYLSTYLKNEDNLFDEDAEEELVDSIINLEISAEDFIEDENDEEKVGETGFKK